MTCPDCSHTAHAGRCFHTKRVDRRYVTCGCKTRDKPKDWLDQLDADLQEIERNRANEPDRYPL